MRPHTYNVGDSLWLSKRYFTDAISKTQKSKKLGVKRYGLFKIQKLVGKNAITLDLPNNMKCHPTIHVEHTSFYKSQPSEIGRIQEEKSKIIPISRHQSIVEVDKILAHRPRGKGYQWLTLLKGYPQHEARWQPTRDFVDADGTITKAFHDYIKEHNLLKNLH